MAKNSFGQYFRITSFGESHGPAYGVVIDGCPSGVSFDQEYLCHCLRRRRPGFHGKEIDKLNSERNEADLPEVLSGVFEGKTLGTPIAIVVKNHDARPQDYDKIKDDARAGHADDVWNMKFGFADHRGGGRASGRETVSRVMAGAVAEMFLKQVAPEIKIVAFAEQIATYLCETPSNDISREQVDQFAARFPSGKQQAQVSTLLLQAKGTGKSYGGKVKLWMSGVPSGLGQPVFHKLKADLASAMLSIGATAAVEIGEGLDVADVEGSEFHRKNSEVYGGIRGGISTGERIELTVTFKPTSSVLDVAKKGRHDPCIVPRAIPVVEAMAALVIADHLLWKRADRL